MEIFMTFNSFLKSPLFLGLSLSICSSIFIRVIGLGLLANIINILAVATLYTFFSNRKEFSRSFKLWAIGASFLFNQVLGFIWPISDNSVISLARSATSDPAFNQYINKISNASFQERFFICKNYVIDMFLKWYGQLGLAIIPFLLLLIAVLIGSIILTNYLPLILGNKLGLLLLKNKSEK